MTLNRNGRIFAIGCSVHDGEQQRFAPVEEVAELRLKGVVS